MRMQDNNVWEQDNDHIGIEIVQRDTKEYWVIKMDTQRSPIEREWHNAVWPGLPRRALANGRVCEYTTGTYANKTGVKLESKGYTRPQGNTKKA